MGDLEFTVVDCWTDSIGASGEPLWHMRIQVLPGLNLVPMHSPLSTMPTTCLEVCEWPPCWSPEGLWLPKLLDNKGGVLDERGLC